MRADNLHFRTGSNHTVGVIEDGTPKLAPHTYVAVRR